MTRHRDRARRRSRWRSAQVSETVTVVGRRRTLVETANATRGIVIDQQKVVDLPLNGRNFTQLGTLIPGVVAPPSGLGGQTGDATPGGFGNVTGGFNVNGMRNQSNNFLMDGATNNDTFNTGFVLRPPPDAIQEFKILTHAFGAEYGRNAGSVVNVVTKSGSNTLTGAAWEFNRDDALQARNFFAPGNQPKPELKQNQFGAALGGPMVQEPPLRVRLLRGLPQRRRHHQQRRGAVGGAARRQLRRHHHPRSADRPAVPQQHHSRQPHQPGRGQAARPTSCRCRTRAGNRYIVSPDDERRARPVRRPRRLSS